MMRREGEFVIESIEWEGEGMWGRRVQVSSQGSLRKIYDVEG